MILKCCFLFVVNLTIFCFRFRHSFSIVFVYFSILINIYPKREMFSYTNSFQGIGLDQWDVKRSYFVNNMFCQAKGLIIDIENLTSWNASLNTIFQCP